MASYNVQHLDTILRHTRAHEYDTTKTFVGNGGTKLIGFFAPSLTQPVTFLDAALDRDTAFVGAGGTKWIGEFGGEPAAPTPAEPGFWTSE